MVLEGLENEGGEVTVLTRALDEEDEGRATMPAALMYSYIESLELPPQISVVSPSQVQVHPALPSGATPPPLENSFPQWHSLWYSIPAYTKPEAWQLARHFSMVSKPS
jgi:hypothetical protein